MSQTKPASSSSLRNRVTGWFKQLFNARSQKPQTFSRNRSRLGLESLEGRDMPASGITATLSDAILTINGTNRSDRIIVRQINGRISVDGVFIRQSGEDFISASRSVSADQVFGIIVHGKGGDDFIALDSESYRGQQPLSVYAATVYGGSGNDRIWGTPGLDYLDGESGRDTIFGRRGEDTLVGTAGLDKLHGGEDNDSYSVHLNLSTLLANRGKSVFHSGAFASGMGTDTVDVTLDLGSVGSKLLRPVLREVKSATRVLQPVLNVLNREVPFLSRVYSGDTTVGGLLGAGNRNLGRFLDRINEVRSLGNLPVSLSGKVYIGEATIRSGSSPTVYMSGLDPLTLIQTKNRTAYDLATRLQRAGFHFGLLENTATAVKMMMRQSADLFWMDLRLPEVRYSYSRQFNMPTGFYGINVATRLGGTIAFSGGAEFGLDTRGLTSGNLLKGFFVRNARATLSAGVTASAGLNLGVPNFLDLGSVYLNGGLNGTLTFSVRGGNKVYATSLSSYTGSVARSGSIRYGIYGSLEYRNLDPFSGRFGSWDEHTWRFKTGTLYR